MLNDEVIPCLRRVLTDRGTEYRGLREYHQHKRYRAIEAIDHTKTKVKVSQTNGICERFDRTIQDEWYAIAFRKKIYRNMDDLQQDLMSRFNDCNHRERTYSGKYCYEKTPLQPFLNSKPMAKEK